LEIILFTDLSEMRNLIRVKQFFWFGVGLIFGVLVVWVIFFFFKLEMVHCSQPCLKHIALDMGKGNSIYYFTPV